MHYLDEIIDPLNRTGVRNEYDEQGRLQFMVDAKGNRVEMSYDPNNSTQSELQDLRSLTKFIDQAIAYQHQRQYPVLTDDTVTSSMK